MKVSVVIPTYAPESYLFECLKSLEDQTLPKTMFEIMIVLNGSKEPYYTIISDYLSKSSLISTLFYSTIKGVSNARNIALDNTKADFVTFIDDDDVVSTNFLESLLKISGNETIVVSNFKTFNNDIIENGIDYLSFTFQKCKCKKKITLINAQSFFSTVWGKLIPLKLIGDVRFDLKMRLGEDSVFMVEISANDPKILLTYEQAIYYRRIRNGSASRSKIPFRTYFITTTYEIWKYIYFGLSSPQKYNIFFLLFRISASLKSLGKFIFKKQAKMYNFKIVELNNIPWDKIEDCYDHNIFKSQAWIEFLIQTQKIAPFVVEVYLKNQLIGYFIGEKFAKIFTIVASPFEGWTTPYQGLSMIDSVSENDRLNIYNELISFLFERKVCSIFQASDWYLDKYIIEKSRLKYELIRGLRLDLTLTEEVIYKRFSSSSCQYAIRKSQKNGVIIREALDIKQFVYHYYCQLTEVFEKQGLKPTYQIDRVAVLIDKLKDTGTLLLLEAVLLDGTCLATGIFVGANRMAYFWGGASYMKYQNLCPNEPIIFEAIKYWKKRGCSDFDLGGVRKYKEKYGPINFEKPKIIASRYPGVLELKRYAKLMYYGVRELNANFKKFFAK